MAWELKVNIQTDFLTGTLFVNYTEGHSIKSTQCQPFKEASLVCEKAVDAVMKSLAGGRCVCPGTSSLCFTPGGAELKMECRKNSVYQ